MNRRGGFLSKIMSDVLMRQYLNYLYIPIFTSGNVKILSVECSKVLWFFFAASNSPMKKAKKPHAQPVTANKSCEHWDSLVNFVFVNSQTQCSL